MIFRTLDEAVGGWGVDGIVEVGVWTGLKHGIRMSGGEEMGRMSAAESPLNVPPALALFERVSADFFNLERYSFISSSDSPSPPQIMLLTGMYVDANSDMLNEAMIAR